MNCRKYSTSVFLVFVLIALISCVASRKIEDVNSQVSILNTRFAQLHDHLQTYIDENKIPCASVTSY